MNNVAIYYFSGTGNSLFVARELQKRIPDADVIPMVSLLNQTTIKTGAATVGFVFPIYFTALPVPVKTFISKLDLQSVGYAFAIATRIGTSHGAFFTIDRILKRGGKRLDSYFSLNMASNDPKFNYKVPTTEEIARLEAAVLERLDAIRRDIVGQVQNRGKDTNCTVRIPVVRLLSSLVNLGGGPKSNLYADPKCNGCGTCAKVCLSGRIQMNDARPVWAEKIRCYHCAACLNYCPMQAVQIKSFTEKNGRYSHPYATVEEIAAQK